MMKLVFEPFNDTHQVNTSASSVIKRDWRLDAAFYCNNNGFLLGSSSTKALSELCVRVFNPPVFKRAFQSGPRNGCRYLASSEIISWQPDTNYIGMVQAQELELKVRRNWILATGFGTIGNIRIVDSTLEDSAIANNVVRIIPKNTAKHTGYIAAFLSSSIGNAILNSRASGSVVRYIEAPSIMKIEVPLLDSDAIEEINSRYLRSVDCREMSVRLLREANFLLHKNCSLPELRKEEQDADRSEVDSRIRMVLSSKVFQTTDGPGIRLDARYYNPTAELAIGNLRQIGSQVKLLGDVVKCILMCGRFKRNYVGSNYGVPFLSGKNIAQIRPTDLKYLANSQIADMKELIVRRGWTLVTCSGTVGNTCFVWNNYEDYAASQHILRVVPDETIIDSGYLYAFLSSAYGYEQILQNRHGSVIDEVTDKQLEQILVPYPSPEDQKAIGDIVRKAYEERSEAIRLEDEAQEILMKELTNISRAKGV
jgi:type I restriction enzyme S subunit